jgi:hypothetical protein
MTPWRLVIFRCLNLTLGRWPAFNRWLKRRLSRRLIQQQSAPYCQCAAFFEFDQLDNLPKNHGDNPS